MIIGKVMIGLGIALLLAVYVEGFDLTLQFGDFDVVEWVRSVLPGGISDKH